MVGSVALPGGSRSMPDAPNMQCAHVLVYFVERGKSHFKQLARLICMLYSFAVRSYIVTEMDFQLRGINIVNDAIQLILAIFAEIVVTPANGSQGALLLKLLLHCLPHNRQHRFRRTHGAIPVDPV